MGCLDLKNVLQTIISKSNDDDTSLIIHLNHSCKVVLARNLLILKVISATGFNAHSQEDVNYLWDLWYNLQWSKSTLERFIEDVKSLIENGLPEEHCYSLDSSQLQDMKDIFQDWLSSSTGSRLTESSQIENILKQRQVLLNDCALEQLIIVFFL